MDQRVRVGDWPLTGLGPLLGEYPLEEDRGLVLGEVGPNSDVVYAHPLNQVIDGVGVVADRGGEPVSQEWGKGIGSYDTALAGDELKGVVRFVADVFVEGAGVGVRTGDRLLR